jgi:hypothetical protein
MTFDDWLQTKPANWIQLAGPREFLLVLWEDATLAERKRCAKVAETWKDPQMPEFIRDGRGCYSAYNEGQECTSPNGIAAAILAG